MAELARREYAPGRHESPVEVLPRTAIGFTLMFDLDAHTDPDTGIEVLRKVSYDEGKTWWPGGGFTRSRGGVPTERGEDGLPIRTSDGYYTCQDPAGTWVKVEVLVNGKQLDAEVRLQHIYAIDAPERAERLV